MAYLFFMLFTLALLAGFVVLVEYESRRSARFFSDARTRLDAQVQHLGFVFTHVDFSAFVRDEAHHQANRAGHAIVEYTLRAVRAIERTLTRFVRYLRTRHAFDVRPRGNAREFVKTLSAFKGQLKATHPEPSDIQ